MYSKYHLDPKNISLKDFQASLEARELIPSRVKLKEKIKSHFKSIDAAGVNTLGDLIGALKNKPELENFSKKTKISIEYLTLLKREAGSLFPNPVRLDKFSGVDGNVFFKLEKIGIKNTKHLFDAALTENDRKLLLKKSSISPIELTELFKLSDLSRLYGVGPVFARILYDVGIDSVQMLLTLKPAEVVKIYEDKTCKKADFSIADIEFTIEMAKHLEVDQ